MNYADEIKRRVTARELFQFYGFEINRGGFCKSPFSSNDKTPSLKVYDGGRGWHDFSSGNGGSVIDFVMQYFGLNFQDAIAKINTDFSLGLPIGERISLRQRREMERQQRERQEERAREQMEREQLDGEYWAAFDLWKKYDTNKREYAPKSPDEEFNPLFVEAVKNIDRADYDLFIAEMRLKDYANHR